jgi:hypothetical protein
MLNTIIQVFGFWQLDILGSNVFLISITRHRTSFVLLGWLSYCLQRVSLAGLPTRLLFLSSISLLTTCVGAVLYRWASGQSWSQSLLKTYGVLFRAPGIGVMNEQSLAAGLVANIIFLFGLLCFATFLSMISDHVKAGGWQRGCAN